jgi:hypothetical protein
MATIDIHQKHHLAAIAIIIIAFIAIMLGLMQGYS